MIQRFRIIRADDGERVYAADSLRDIEEWLMSRDQMVEEYKVHDLEDDIMVHADDIIDAYYDGERYEDLQGF